MQMQVNHLCHHFRIFWMDPLFSKFGHADSLKVTRTNPLAHFHPFIVAHNRPDTWWGALARKCKLFFYR